MHQNSIAKQEDTNRKRDNPAETMRHVSQYQGHQSNPDIVKNVTVFAAVLGTAGRRSHARTRGCYPQSSSALVWENFVSSKLCIDKGRHRSAFHHSVHDAHKKEKNSRNKDISKDQKEKKVLTLSYETLTTKFILFFFVSMSVLVTWTLTFYNWI